MKVRYTLKNRRRFYIFVMVVLVAVSVIFVSKNAYGYKPQQSVNVTIKSGDTLWDIASKFSNGGDVREYIYKIKKLNHLKSEEIYAGICLQLPVE